MTTKPENQKAPLVHCACGRPELGLDTPTAQAPPIGAQAPPEEAITTSGPADDRERRDAAPGASRSKV
jgi:hypothetical protein